MAASLPPTQRDAHAEPSAGGVEFGMLLRNYRVAAGLSQEALAERARMSTNGVGALERGYRRTPQRETLGLLAAALALNGEQRREFEAAAARSGLRHPARSSFRIDPAPGSGIASLPHAASNFVGRDAELAEISALLKEHRLVTLTGTGGVGKTQTALQVARLRGEARTACFVALAPPGGPFRVLAAIAAALGVREEPNRALLDTLVAHLKEKSLLLILDNCEHVLDAAAKVAGDLLRECPRVRILATSREPLRTAGERRYRLPSLKISPAVLLFTDRAQVVEHRFALTDENAGVVAEICRRLDGIPLAIELAAARVGVLSLPEIAEKLNYRFGLLVSGTEAAIPRQETMRATIEWSYNLLSDDERRLFERLAIFAGGCTLHMAATVCSDDDDDSRTFDLLSSLVDKSLVCADVDTDETRYQLLETTREYARYRLDERGGSQAIAQRHARALLDLAREIAGSGATYNARLDRSPAVLRVMRAERANFDEAMYSTLVRREDIHLGQELAWRVPFLRATDAQRWLNLALEAVDESTPVELITNLHIQLGWCFVDLRDHEKAIAHARRAIAASQSHGEKRLLAAARRLLGRAFTHAWRLDEAELQLQKALAIWRKLGDRLGVATTLSYLGFVAFRRSDYAHARRLNLDALRALGAGDERYARLIKIELARAEYGLGNYEAALAYSHEILPGLEIEAAEGGSTCVILMLNQCTFLLALDRFEEAMEVARRALAVTLNVQNPRPDLLPYVAGTLAKVALLRPGSPSGGNGSVGLSSCSMLIGWNQAVCAARGESDPEETAAELSLLRHELGARRVETLLSEGAALDDGTAIELTQSLFSRGSELS